MFPFYLPPALLQRPCLLVAGSGGSLPALVPLFLVWCPFFCDWPTQEAPLDHLVLTTRRAFVPGSHRIVAAGEMVLVRLLLPGHCTDCELRRIPSLAVKKASLLLLEHQLEGQTSGLAHLVAYRAALKECRLLPPAWHSPSVLLQLTGVTQKRVTLIWSPDYCGCGPVDNSRLPNSGGQWSLPLQFHRTVYICIF